jgi:L-seryl-tRNA(Ser) seleniumtransferase
MATTQTLFRKLPAIDELLRRPALASLAECEGHAAVTDAARQVLDTLRTAIAAGKLEADGINCALGGIDEAVVRQVRASFDHSLGPVVNATGVILHTNLGRAPLSEGALEHIGGTAGRYCNLEFDIASGERGKRDVHAERLFARLLDPADVTRNLATVVVNNNAAAVLLGLNTLAEGGEAIVSRGELVEIGDSFRIPEIMAKSGARLCEVGTTNRTRLADYESAIHERTRVLLRVHRSNFQMVGFTGQPALTELVALGHRHSLPVMEDLGSGALFDLRAAGIAGEPNVAASLRAGVDVVTYSGDKLLGGPQAGMLSGSREWIARIRQNPLFRALRVDKLTYAALEATLLAYLRQDSSALPALRFMRLTKEEIGARAAKLAEQACGAGRHVEVIDGESVLGGGTAPGATLPTKLIAVACRGLSADALVSRLREQRPPIVARVEEGKVLIDLRTVFPEQDAIVLEALQSIPW